MDDAGRRAEKRDRERLREAERAVGERAKAKISDMVRESLERLGGVDYLTQLAQDPATVKAYISLVSKLMPNVTDIGDNATKTFAALVADSYRERLPDTRTPIIDVESVSRPPLEDER